MFVCCSSLYWLPGKGTMLCHAGAWGGNIWRALGCRDGLCLGISGKRQQWFWHQHWMAIAALKTWQWRKCSADHTVPGVPGLWGSTCCCWRNSTTSFPDTSTTTAGSSSFHHLVSTGTWSFFVAAGRNALHKTDFLAPLQVKGTTTFPGNAWKGTC